MPQTFETLPFDNTYARLPEAFHSALGPMPVRRPHLVAFSEDAAALIDLDPREAERPEAAEYLSGSRRLPGAQPVAMVYSGHQFGVYVPQLGDGRALLLGEVRNGRGEKWDLHLKGGGQTPYSRMGDGRAVLRSSIREFLCSEAMAGLGIPTTRALSVVGCDDLVHRETVETGAVVMRLAPSHVRFGTFEFFAHTGQHRELRTLADYVIGHHFPHLAGCDDRVLRLLHEVAASTGRLIAQWQAAGFAHGVMNSDNMSILGLTIDYGPFGFLDDYDPGFICNHSDPTGRYAFDQQPGIGLWNVRCLASALLPLISREEALAAVDAYEPAFRAEFDARMHAKLGLRETREGDLDLVIEFLDLMATGRADHTNTWRELGTIHAEAGPAPLRDVFIEPERFDAWLAAYRARVRAEGTDDAERRRHMNGANPKYILRNWLAQRAIEQAQRGDFTEVQRLHALLRRPFDEQPEMESYAARPPDWGKHLAVSCSS